MIDTQALSLTSNTTKLLKHPDVLAALQAGRAQPVHLVVAPTNRCNLACPHCCFADRDVGQELDLHQTATALEAFRSLGLKSVEFAGGGEPTLYPHLRSLVELADEFLGLPVGLCTNGTVVKGVPWQRFDWVRLSLNALDEPAWRGRWEAGAAEIAAATVAPSGCYIVRPDAHSADLRRAVEAAQRLGLPTRLAADCRHPAPVIADTLAMLRHEIEALGHPPGVFVSDFNTPLGPGPRALCRMHLVKPMLAADGWIYSCPSSELAAENPADVGEAYRVCRAEDVLREYSKPPAGYAHGCSFCKYADHNAMIEQALAPVRFDAFV